MEPTAVHPQHAIFRCADCSSEWADELPSLGAWLLCDAEDWPWCEDCSGTASLVEPL
jgi:hypothetical protein